MFSAETLIPSKEPPSATDWAARIRGGPVAGTSTRSVCWPSALAMTPTEVVGARTTTGVYAEPSGKTAWIGNGFAFGHTEARVGPAGPDEVDEGRLGTGRLGPGSTSSSPIAASAAPTPIQVRICAVMPS